MQAHWCVPLIVMRQVLTGRKKFMDLAHWIRRDDLYTVVPPEPFKDWNEILIKKGGDFLKNRGREDW
jgi:hypothetical protein